MYLDLYLLRFLRLLHILINH